MKTYILSSFAFFLIFLTTPLTAQTQVEPNKNNYVVLTRKIPQLQPIILSAEALAEEDNEKFGDFQTIICGKTVQELTNKDALVHIIQKAEKAHVQILICGFSLNKFGVDRNELPEEFKVVENGILYNLQLQKQGYLSIEL